MYWWSEEISVLRRSSIKARRSWYRSKKNGESEVLAKRKEYKRAKRLLRNAIQNAKNASWSELLRDIDKDPWGLPYKLVMGKLRKSDITLSETLESPILNDLLTSLFPRNISDIVPPRIPHFEWVEDMDINVLDVVRFIKKRSARNATPGPDGLKATVWKKVPDIILCHVAEVFTLCMRQGVFPAPWKRALLVLIPKGSSGDLGEIKARPICLLDKLSKTLERVIADRINRCLEENEAYSLSDNQFGFRKNRSTLDAHRKVREYTQPGIDHSGFAIAVGIDIANAFKAPE